VFCPAHPITLYYSPSAGYSHNQHV